MNWRIIHLGRKFIGIEKDAEYMRVAKRRIENAMPLFVAHKGEGG